MHDIFIDALEKKLDFRKRSDMEFKAEACVYCVAEVHTKCLHSERNYPSEKNWRTSLIMYVCNI